jgi:hypothetical protein
MAWSKKENSIRQRLFAFDPPMMTDRRRGISRKRKGVEL